MQDHFPFPFALLAFVQQNHLIPLGLLLLILFIQFKVVAIIGAFCGTLSGCVAAYLLSRIHNDPVGYITIACFLGVLSAIVLGKLSRWEQLVHSFPDRNFVLSVIARKFCFWSTWSAAAGAILGLNVVVFADLFANGQLGMGWIAGSALVERFWACWSWVYLKNGQDLRLWLRLCCACFSRAGLAP